MENHNNNSDVDTEEAGRGERQPYFTPTITNFGAIQDLTAWAAGSHPNSGNL
jgi:hypothetical protein